MPKLPKIFKTKIARRILGSFLLLTFLGLTLLGAMLMKYFYDERVAEQETELLHQARILAATLPDSLYESPSDLTKKIDSIREQTGLRITILDDSGNVLADSNSDVESMDNHLNRPEVQTALSESYGINQRYSDTLGETMLYVAIPFYQQGRFAGMIRTSTSLQPIHDSLHHAALAVLFSLGAAFLLSILLAMMLASRQLKPIVSIIESSRRIIRGDLSGRIDYHTGDEFDVLIHAMNRVTERLGEMLTRQADFVSNAAHELRTPLTSIQGFAELLADDDFSDPKVSRHCSEVILQESTRMNRLITSLLELAKLDNDETRELLTKKQAPIEAGAVLRDAATSLHRKAQKKGQLLELSIETSAKLSASKDLFRQILINLIDNAINYTPDGGHIHLSCRKVQDSIEIRVADNGIGISAENLPHIFDRFYRVDKARSRKSGGNGVGLSLVQTLTKLFGGTIHVESHAAPERETGTVFTLRFPLA